MVIIIFRLFFYLSNVKHFFKKSIQDDVFSDEDSASDVSSEASDSEDEYDPDKEKDEGKFLIWL